MNLDKLDEKFRKYFGNELMSSWKFTETINNIRKIEYTDRTAYEIPVPGFTSKNLNIVLDSGIVSISGTRKSIDSQVINMNHDVPVGVVNHITASWDNGLLILVAYKEKTNN